MNRRYMLLGAGAAVVPSSTSHALPARLLDYIPCDGRELRISEYPELFEALKRDGGYCKMPTPETFCIPDTREFSEKHPVRVADVVLLIDVISTGRDGREPAGRILLMETSRDW